jgi:hypothetical protein
MIGRRAVERQQIDQRVPAAKNKQRTSIRDENESPNIGARQGAIRTSRALRERAASRREIALARVRCVKRNETKRTKAFEQTPMRKSQTEPTSPLTIPADVDQRPIQLHELVRTSATTFGAQKSSFDA